MFVFLFWSSSINSKYLDLLSMAIWMKFKNPFRSSKSYINVTFRAIYNQKIWENPINSNHATRFYVILQFLDISFSTLSIMVWLLNYCLQFFFKDISVHQIALLSSRDRFLNFMLLFCLFSIHRAFALHLSFIGTRDTKINHVKSNLLSV